MGGAGLPTIERHPYARALLSCLLLLGAYYGALRPVRVWVMQRVAAPVFTAVSAAHPEGGYDVVWTPREPTRITAEPRCEGAGEPSWNFVAPAGTQYVVPALLLVAAFPARPYWLYLLAYHLALGVAGFGAFALALAGHPLAFAVHEFTQTYAVDAVSMGAPVLLFLAGDGRRRRGGGEGSEPPG